MSGPADFIYLFEALNLALARGYEREYAEQILAREIAHGRMARELGHGATLLLPTDPPINLAAGLRWKTVPKLNFERSEIEVPTHYPDRRLPPGQRMLQARSIRRNECNRVEWCAIKILVEDIARIFPDTRADLTSAFQHQQTSRGIRTNKDKKAEADCGEWIAEFARSNKRPKKEDLKTTAIKTFFPHLSGEAFDRAWEKNAPVDWKVAGRPKKAGNI